MVKDLSQAKMEFQRNLVKTRKKMLKKVKSQRRLKKLKEFLDISLQEKCQIHLRNKQMNKIDLCKLEKRH